MNVPRFDDIEYVEPPAEDETEERNKREQDIERNNNTTRQKAQLADNTNKRRRVDVEIEVEDSSDYADDFVVYDDNAEKDNSDDEIVNVSYATLLGIYTITTQNQEAYDFAFAKRYERCEADDNFKVAESKYTDKYLGDAIERFKFPTTEKYIVTLWKVLYVLWKCYQISQQKVCLYHKQVKNDIPIHTGFVRLR
eukprot:TRINITY_DN7905_c0_g1_i1.p1 TRINITY_DN7905_c0_g1~~TRINITY_DN7905_c0_g1_i1.p1  ORF type:complete len:195 (+),score=23.30 TRINITY_DN7905_c0_g1_i1:181-765(+)